MDVIRLIRAALTAKKTKERRAMAPSIDPAARRTAMCFFLSHFRGPDSNGRIYIYIYIYLTSKLHVNSIFNFKLRKRVTDILQPSKPSPLTGYKSGFYFLDRNNKNLV